MYKYIVEAIYQRPIQTKNEAGEPRWNMLTDLYRREFQHENQSTARHAAQKDMDEIIRYGLKVSGGAVIKSIILPSCVLQIGLVDDQVLQKEQLADLASVGTFEPTVVEPDAV